MRVLWPVPQKGIDVPLLWGVPSPQQLHPQALRVKPAAQQAHPELTKRQSSKQIHRKRGDGVRLLDRLVEIADAVDDVEQAPPVGLDPLQRLLRADHRARPRPRPARRRASGHSPCCRSRRRPQPYSSTEQRLTPRDWDEETETVRNHVTAIPSPPGPIGKTRVHTSKRAAGRGKSGVPETTGSRRREAARCMEEAETAAAAIGRGKRRRAIDPEGGRDLGKTTARERRSILPGLPSASRFGSARAVSVRVREVGPSGHVAHRGGESRGCCVWSLPGSRVFVRALEYPSRKFNFFFLKVWVFF